MAFKAAKPSATVRYTLSRLAIFIGCFFVVWGLVYFGLVPRGLGDANILWVLILAILLSTPVSIVLLRKQRDEMSEQIVSKVDRTKQRMESNRSMEDGATE